LTRAYIGLGANLGDRERTMRRALELLGDGVVAVSTELAVERELGRTREGPGWGPRAIDLDLLLYGDEVVDEPGLRVPHPRLHERRFALEPLAELDPSLVVPGAGPVGALLAGLQ